MLDWWPDYCGFSLAVMECHLSSLSVSTMVFLLVAGLSVVYLLCGR